ncbi:uncharacterized protein N0V89_005877 [Didymosphaeria variabile]|uniref:Nephrocystin 3-like N-terminal domain-containing protein n=1 Tax=Didymosphaeria variabile TaxID=1932322 RepID=A0A9W9CBW7_9PLEO|nr:uncharacterized protein N0V89_005877 [Didymosphaeria variabile]KAJ4354144.1 hypothetical protein N0V89_005877 [Didymosphaeria variabile]
MGRTCWSKTGSISTRLISTQSSDRTVSTAKEPELLNSSSRKLGKVSTANQAKCSDNSRHLTDEFCNIIQQYESVLFTQARSAKINIRGAHSWDEVIRAAKDTEAAYIEEAKKGAKGAVRGYLRQFGDYSATATPWIGLLPNDKYFSVLCGGLKIVLGVGAVWFEITARRSERRIEIFEAFETLPAVIEKTQRCHEIFPDSLELRDRALTVYLDILMMIEAMIACLMDKKLLTRIKDGLKGPLADQDLDEKKRRFHMSMEALEEQVNHLHLSSSAKTNASIANMGPSVHRTENVVLSIDNTTKVLHSSARTVVAGIDGLRSDVTSHEQATQMLKKEIEMQRQAIELQSQAHNSLSSLLQDVIKNAEWYTARVQRAYDAIDRNVDLRGLQLQLGSHLGHTLEDVGQDLDLVTRNAQSCDAQSQGAMHWVLQSPRLKRWIQSPYSDVLAVDGNLEDGMARYSSTSLLCGMLIQSLREQKGVHVLHFFCGTHSSRFDPLSGPRGLLQSLIAQLLSIQQFDVGFLRFGQWEGGLRANSINTLCRLFKRLVEQLPNSVVFCIIDGISIFEVETWLDELHLVVRTLLETVADEQLIARLKFLGTAASRSRCLNSLLSERDRLSVPTNGGDQRLLTSRSAYSELVDGRRSPMFGAGGHSSYEDMYDKGFD